ncbi:hypothetical protein BC749_101769 [Flavobacterium araucananum]|nr:hypothetical protein BC749_101769 [Flavobacterium araucananum]
MYGETDKALANLHVVSNAFPDEKIYLALLASTYMEAEADDAAAEYCNINRCLTILNVFVL